MATDSTRLTRRQFSQSAAAAFVGAHALAAPAQDKLPPSDRLGLGFIGLGGMGQGHLAGLRKQPDVEVVALCDVDRGRLTKIRQSFGERGVAAYGDFRELLSNDKVDAVVIATPDHWHGLTAIAAADAKKDIYCEKPLTNSIGEGRALCDAVSQNKVILQTGSHERSNPGAITARRLIEEGRFGKIHTVRIQLPLTDSHLQQVRQASGLPPTTEVPDGFDYDFWLGHTPKVPYTQKRCHFWWRFISSYGGGEMTDRGCHVIDLAQMVLGNDATGPISVNAIGEPANPGLFDACLDFRFENRFADGLRMVGNNQAPRGVWFEGTKGRLFIAVHGGALSAEPASLLEGVSPERPQNHAAHRRNFLDAVKSRQHPNAPVEAGHRTATICHLNNIALKIGRSFRWDPVKERSDDAQVNALLTPKMRPPGLFRSRKDANFLRDSRKDRRRMRVRQRGC